jgi:hypothetical protein
MICQIEGKKKQVNIAQVKEILKIIISNPDVFAEFIEIARKMLFKKLNKNIKQNRLPKK